MRFIIRHRAGRAETNNLLTVRHPASFLMMARQFYKEIVLCQNFICRQKTLIYLEPTIQMIFSLELNCTTCMAAGKLPGQTTSRNLKACLAPITFCNRLITLTISQEIRQFI